MEDRISRGTTITRFNYNRPKWFGGFFGWPYKHNLPGNCLYDPETVSRIISPENLNRMVEPMYEIGTVMAYHMAITIFLVLSVLLLLIQQGYSLLVEFAFMDLGTNSFMKAVGIIWYIVWGLGLVTIVPLYFLAVQQIEKYFRDADDPIFRELGVRVNIRKEDPS